MVRYFKALFPSPRGRISWIEFAPAMLFLVLFLTVWITLEWQGVLLLTKPWNLLWLLVTPWLTWISITGGAGLSRWRGRWVLFLRLCLVGLFVLLLCEPRSVRTSDSMATVFAIDVSDSIGESSLTKLQTLVARLAREKPAKDDVGLIAFGGNAAVELPPRNSFPLDNAINSVIQRDATNLTQALELALAVLPEEKAGRIVLMSDGAATEGNLEPVLDLLRSRNVTVDIVPAVYSYEDEVWVERLDLPRSVKKGDSYEATVILSSLKAGRGTLELRENGKSIHKEEVTFAKGKNRLSIPIQLREPGYYEYVAEIIPGPPVDSPLELADHLRENNRAVNQIFIEGDGKLLIVADDSPNARSADYESIVRALEEEQRKVDVVSPFDVPRDPLALRTYDALMFVNVPADSFDPQQFESIRDAVFELGLGFIMVGGENSFGPGGYQRTPIEEILPVSMDITNKKVLPKGALAIILHTCEFPEGNTWAKRITKQAIKVLGAQDEVGVLAFLPEGDAWVFELTPAADYEQLAVKINAADPGDMPGFGPTMTMALEGLKKSDASAKHMIVISDGDPPAPPPSLINEYQALGITISTIAIFPHSGAEIETLQQIALSTKGRFYYPDDPRRLPGIFIKESKTIRRNLIQVKDIKPEVGFPSQILKGVESIPNLGGYVLTSLKPKLAQNVLEYRADDEQLDPILAIWNFGIGKTAAFTSDLSTNWGARWVNWEGYRAFVKQLVSEVARVKTPGNLHLALFANGNTATILVEDFHPDQAMLELKARISGPGDRTESVALKQIGPRRYQGEFKMWGTGRYQTLVSGVQGERSDRAFGTLVQSYSPEYLRFRSDPILLEQVAEATGGRVLSPEIDPKELFEYGRTTRTSSRPIFDWFILACAFCLLCDVALRRVQIDFSTIQNWFTPSKRLVPVSAGTTSALLKRKIFSGPKASPIRISPTSRKIPESEKKIPPTGQVARPMTIPQGDGSTTGKLLEQKRKRQQSNDSPDG